MRELKAVVYACVALVVCASAGVRAQRTVAEIQQDVDARTSSASAQLRTFAGLLNTYLETAQAIAATQIDVDALVQQLNGLKDEADDLGERDLRNQIRDIISGLRGLDRKLNSQKTSANRDVGKLDGDADPFLGYADALDDALFDNCLSAQCQNGACVDGDEGYTCDCHLGYEGELCDINTDECAGSPCVHGVCIDEIGGYLCVCDEGYTGVNCDEEVPTGPEFVMQTTRMSWEDARAACMQQGMDLVSITSQQIQDVVTALFNQHRDSVSGSINKYYYTSGVYREGQLVWAALDDLPVADGYTNWLTGQPSIQHGPPQDGWTPAIVGHCWENNGPEWCDVSHYTSGQPSICQRYN